LTAKSRFELLEVGSQRDIAFQQLLQWLL